MSELIDRESVREFIKSYRNSTDVAFHMEEHLDEIPAATRWVSVDDRMPNPEEEVEVAYVYKHWKDGHEVHLTCRGMYEDGKIATDDSNYVWDDTFGFDYDEDIDDYLIPEGWYECSSFSDTFGDIDMRVTHWMPLPKTPGEEDK